MDRRGTLRLGLLANTGAGCTSAQIRARSAHVGATFQTTPRPALRAAPQRPPGRSAEQRDVHAFGIPAVQLNTLVTALPSLLFAAGPKVVELLFGESRFGPDSGQLRQCWRPFCTDVGRFLPNSGRVRAEFGKTYPNFVDSSQT